MVSNISFNPYYTHYTPAFSGKINPVKIQHKGKDFLIGSLIALSSLSVLSCQMDSPDFNHIDRKAVHDPCCATTQTQFKDLMNPLDKMDLMLNNLGIIDSNKTSWEDIGVIMIKGDDGSDFIFENRGVKLDGGYLKCAFTKIEPDGRKDSVICHMTNGYGGIDVSVEATNNKLIGEIPYDYAYIWQGDKGSKDNRFVIVNTAPKGLWDNVMQLEKVKGNRVQILGKDGQKTHLLLDTAEIFNKEV